MYYFGCDFEIIIYALVDCKGSFSKMSKLPTSRLPVTPAKTTTNTAKSGLRPPQSTSNNATNTSQQISPSGGDSANNSFSIGDRVTANGKSGTVAFIGTTKFAEGIRKLRSLTALFAII